MEINADNLRRLGFVRSDDDDTGEYAQFSFPAKTSEWNIYVHFEWGAFPEVTVICFEPQEGESFHDMSKSQLIIPHAKTIEHIQQLINLFIEPVKVEKFGEIKESPSIPENQPDPTPGELRELDDLMALTRLNELATEVITKIPREEWISQLLHFKSAHGYPPDTGEAQPLRSEHYDAFAQVLKELLNK